MVAKFTSKKRIALPKVRRPSQEKRADEVRAKLADLGINKRDVANAVKWARKSA